MQEGFITYNCYPAIGVQSDEPSVGYFLMIIFTFTFYLGAVSFELLYVLTVLFLRLVFVVCQSSCP